MSNISWNIELRSRKVAKTARSPVKDKPSSSLNRNKSKTVSDCELNTLLPKTNTLHGSLESLLLGKTENSEFPSVFDDHFEFPPVSKYSPETRFLFPPTPSARSTIVNSAPIQLINMPSFNLDQASKMIPDYNGGSADLHRFLRMADLQYRKATTPGDKADCLEVIDSKLVGRAYDVVLRYNTYETWEDLKATLNMHFAKQRSLQLIHSDIFSMRQIPKETMEIYAEKAEKLLDELNIASTINITGEGGIAVRANNEALVLNSFVNGLRDPLRLILRAARTNSLQKAIELTFEEEKLLVPPIHNNSNRPYCSYCRSNTHYTNDCRRRQPFTQVVDGQQSSLPKFINNNNQSTSPANPGTTAVECRYCKKSGHSIGDCRKRKYNNERKNQGIHPESSHLNQGNYQQPGPSDKGVQASNFK